MKIHQLDAGKRLFLGTYLCLFSSLLLAQEPAITHSKGMNSKALGAIDLGPEIEGMTGRQLRGRAVTIDPGGVIATHSHKDRPCIEYVVQGNVVEYRNGRAIEHAAGDAILDDRNVSHGWENKGSTPVVLLTVDVFKP